MVDLKIRIKAVRMTRSLGDTHFEYPSGATPIPIYKVAKESNLRLRHTTDSPLKPNIWRISLMPLGLSRCLLLARQIKLISPRGTGPRGRLLNVTYPEPALQHRLWAFPLPPKAQTRHKTRRVLWSRLKASCMLKSWSVICDRLRGSDMDINSGFRLNGSP